MLDTTKPQGQLIDAALKLAAEKPWQTVSLAEIAARAGMTLADLSREFASRSDIIAAFAAAADAEMLRRAPPPVAEQSHRDALFEVIMCRLDTLAPYKQALRSIAKASATDPALLRPFLATQGWMLEAAGIGHDGLGGTARVAGLATVYASVLRTWLADDDPGMARTMAALDQRLRRGETVVSAVSGACDTAARVVEAMRAGWSRARTPPPAPAAPTAEPPPPPPA